MNQYKCSSCHEVFDEPITESGYLSEAWGHSVHEDYHRCPCCGSYDIEYREEGFWEEDDEEEEDEE